jgi:hypothetical protein
VDDHNQLDRHLFNLQSQSKVLLEGGRKRGEAGVDAFHRFVIHGETECVAVDADKAGPVDYDLGQPPGDEVGDLRVECRVAVTVAMRPLLLLPVPEGPGPTGCLSIVR